MSGYKVLKKVLSDKITIYERTNSNHHHYYFRLNGITYRGSTHTNNLSESEEYCVLKYHEIKKTEGRKSKDITFSKCVKIFLEGKKLEVKEKTFHDYELRSRFLIEYFKNIDPSSIDDDDLKSYDKWRRNYYKSHPKKVVHQYKRKSVTIKKSRNFDNVGDITINRDIGLLKNIMKYCVNDNKLYIKKMPYLKKYKEKPRKETLVKAEYQKLKNYFLKTNPYYWSIISFLQNTGIRYPSELNSIKWKHIHLDRGFINLENRKNDKDDDKIWSVPLVGTSERIIIELKSRENISREPEDYVFVNSKNKRIMNISKSFKKACIECGITKKLVMYSLRHTYATRMVSTRPDIPLHILAESMGHVDTTMIERKYKHLRPEVLVKFFKQSEDHKNQILNDRKQDQSESQLDESK
ncbi:MAG: site-specific integrase [Syntrophus sp. (in: bacteria)]